MNDVVSGSFEWDSEKDETNRRKHGIAFKHAATLFEEPYLRVLSTDMREERWVALGRADGQIIAVIYTERNGRIRIISARMARRHEREIYKDRIGGMS
jgi:hypothetical protein